MENDLGVLGIQPADRLVEEDEMLRIALLAGDLRPPIGELFRDLRLATLEDRRLPGPDHVPKLPIAQTLEVQEGVLSALLRQVLELAGFQLFHQVHDRFLEDVLDGVGIRPGSHPFEPSDDGLVVVGAEEGQPGFRDLTKKGAAR